MQVLPIYSPTGHMGPWMHHAKCPQRVQKTTGAWLAVLMGMLRSPPGHLRVSGAHVTTASYSCSLFDSYFL